MSAGVSYKGTNIGEVQRMGVGPTVELSMCEGGAQLSPGINEQGKNPQGDCASAA